MAKTKASSKAAMELTKARRYGFHSMALRKSLWASTRASD